ncbi:MAG: MoaD/ThiS family protein [Dehalococcoidales bacterium]|nr:MoaD/ThiS family protein [Dehalococcoidales bacterium]
MSVEIELASIFRSYTDNQLNIKVEGRTVGDCLQDLFRQFPEIEKLLMGRDGKLHRSYDIYINGESAYPKEMSKPVKDGDKLNIVFIVYGG